MKPQQSNERSRKGLKSYTPLLYVYIGICLSGCNTQVVVDTSTYADTADQPAAIAPGVPQPLPPTVVLDGPGWQILIDGFTLINLIHHPILPGGVFPGGDRQHFSAHVQIHLVGTGTLAGWQRNILMPFNGAIDSNVRPYGANVQSFATELFMLDGQISGDPDFDLLRIQAGTGFGMPSPGHTTLTRQGDDWNVDSHFDIVYHVEFIGAPGGVLSGQADLQQRQQHIQIGQAPTSGSWTEKGDAPPLLPGQETVGDGPLNSINGALSFTNDVDLYCIRIDDPLQFQATTVGGTAFNTQLFLLDSGGIGITHNDDNPGGGTQSTITGQFVPGSGHYLLAISAFNRDPVNPANQLIWNNGPSNVERPPDGLGAPGPLSNWISFSGASGAYTVHLTGCRFCATPPPPIIVDPGNDYWVMDDPLKVIFGGTEIPPIPADFFNPGSLPFTGVILFGVNSTNPFLGDADTILRRTTSANLPSIGAADSVLTEIFELRLRSIDTIDISGIEWKVELTLPEPQPSGAMQIQRLSLDGGSFTTDLYIRPVFIFARVDDSEPPRVFDPGVIVTLSSTLPSNWSTLPPADTYPGGGPNFYPLTPLDLLSPGGMHTTLVPAFASGPPRNCPPLDLNFDNLHNSEDLQAWVEAFLAGPSHPSFCAVDANANHLADLEDIQISVAVLLNWPSTLIAVGDWVNIDAECDYRHHSVTGECREPPRANRTRHIVVQAADKDGNPSNCPVKFRLYKCDGVGTEKAVEVEPGDNECVTVPENRTLQVWCKRDGDNVPCRISIKDVGGCP